MDSLCSCGKVSKYCCPRCKLRTCSLVCSKNHKSQKNCNGVADKTQFIKVSEFDNLKLISDYKFLEQVKEGIESSHRYLADVSCGPSIAFAIKSKCITNNTLLKLMPSAFTRKIMNKSYFKDEMIYWTVELVFTDSLVKLLAEDICEALTINDIIEKYSAISGSHSEYKFVSNFYKENSDASYFIKADVGVTSSFHKLDPSISLSENLKFKTVIEFPTIYISHNKLHFHTVECVPYDVKEEMKRLGILPKGKRRWKGRRQSQKKRCQSNYTFDSDKSTGGKNDHPKITEDSGSVGNTNNPFKSNVLKLFCGDLNNESEFLDYENNEIAASKQNPVSEAEDGEITE